MSQSASDKNSLEMGAIAQLFHVTEKAVRDWIEAGLPVVHQGTQGRGKKTKINLRDAVEWYFSAKHEQLDLDRQSARLKRAQSEKAEHELRVRTGQLLERHDVIRDGQALIGAMRARLRALPSRLAPSLSTSETYAAVRAQIAAGVDEALEEIADEKFASNVAAKTLDLRADESSSTAAEADGERVGGSTPRVVKRVKRRAGKVANRSRRVSTRNHGCAK